MQSRTTWPSWLPRPSAVEWLCIVVGTVLALRYAWLIDDAYVYYRYIDNLVLHNHGLVYNPGEFVDSFSSPLWGLLLIAPRILGLDYWAVTLIIAVLSYWTFAFLLIDLNRRLSGDKGGWTINFPLIHLTGCYGVLCYFTSGIETPLVQVVAVAFACLLLRPNSTLLQVAVGLAPILRHELALPWLVMLVWFWRREKKLPWAMIATAAVTVGGWLAFRVYYYADLFPNAFYLKDEVMIGQGLAYVYDTVAPYFTVPILLLFVVLHIVLKRSDRLADFPGKPRVTMLLLSLVVALYVVKIGGDPRHYRYLAFSYILAVAATGGLLEQLLSGARRETIGRYALPVGSLILLFGLLCFPRQLGVHPLYISFLRGPYTQEEWDAEGFHRQTLKINDALQHRVNSKVTPPSLWQALAPPPKPAPRPPGRSKVLGTSHCVVAYLDPHVHIVHTLGYTDPVLARVIAESDRAAHKLSLIPLAQDIVRIRRRYPRGPGAFAKAAKDPRCPTWIRANLESLKAVERKMYNRHDFFANLATAFTPIPRLNLDG